jgi:hypothetical protein
MQRPEEFVPVSLEPDPVIEYYKQFIDRSLLRENLKLTPTERVRKMQEMGRVYALSCAAQEQNSEMTDERPETTDFERVLRALHDAGVEFILVGGLAAVVWGASRFTRDIDLVYRRTPENLRRLADALAPFAPYPRDAPPNLPFQWDATTLQYGLNFTLSTDAGPIDLLGEVVGGGVYDALREAAVEVELFGMSPACASGYAS